MKIHQSAIVHPDAVLGDDVEIGPFSVIGTNVTIGEGTIVKNSVTITGNTTIGKNNIIYPNAVLGEEPQDLKYKGELTSLLMGDNNVIRECVTINVGTAGGGGKTVLGNNNFIMACVHIAHDCIIEDNVLIGKWSIAWWSHYSGKERKVNGTCWCATFCDYWTICICGRSYQSCPRCATLCNY